MEMVQIGYAKTHLSALLGRVEQGEELAIARRGKIVAKLVPVQTDARPASVAFEQAWALGGLDLPDNLSQIADVLPVDDIILSKAERRAVLEQFQRSAFSKVIPGPNAARSQDFLYGDDGLPA